MPWFKVDDNLAFHSKTIRAGNAAMGLWVRAGAWSSQNLTDGYLPDHMLPMIGTRPQAKKLVAVGLWKEVSGGFCFHEWDERQPKRDAIEGERAAARERMRLAREAKKGQKKTSSQVSESCSPEVRRTSPSAFGNPDPTRPDPTLVPTELERAPKRATQLAKTWQPTTEHVERAKTGGLAIDREADKFRQHADEKGRTAKNWNAAFTRWLMNAEEYAQTNRPKNEPANNDWMRRRL